MNTGELCRCPWETSGRIEDGGMETKDEKELPRRRLKEAPLNTAWVIGERLTKSKSKLLKKGRNRTAAS
jgi:hypothetical protein